MVARSSLEATTSELANIMPVLPACAGAGSALARLPNATTAMLPGVALAAKSGVGRRSPATLPGHVAEALEEMVGLDTVWMALGSARQSIQVVRKALL
mmetsp:Transcript_57258/g.177723  ORF Transcript_57258/g.177723 Transcript_57258/m.177723 type:complete len:98 (+) Transcript_57258:65-358(+)